MYSFITHTWNPIKGKCLHECVYCYMKKWREQKPVRFDEKEFLGAGLGEGNYIFVCSGTDMWGDWIPDEWIADTLAYCKNWDNTYLFQTKNPFLFQRFEGEFPAKTVLCCTIETNKSYFEMGKAPNTFARSCHMSHIEKYDKMITIEPVIDFDTKEFVKMIDDIEPMQINIGADSGNNNLPEPSPEKLQNFITILQGKEYNVHLKKNLNRLLIPNLSKNKLTKKEREYGERVSERLRDESK